MAALYIPPIPHPYLISSTMKKLYSLPLLACMFTALPMGSAAAATVVQTKSFDLVDGDFNPTFNGFDTSLGTLQSVYIILTYTREGGYLGIDNESDSVASVTFSHTTRFDVDTEQDPPVLNWANAAGGSRLLATSLNRTISTLANQSVPTDSDEAPDFAGSDYRKFDLAVVTKSTDGYFLDINQFNNKSAFSIPVSVAQSNSITGLGGSAQSYLPADLTGSLALTYEYSPAAAVPEPSVAVLSMVTLTGFGLIRRRRLA